MPRGKSAKHQTRGGYRDMVDVFEKMDDVDFFSDKVTHIYFNKSVSDESVNELLQSIHKANESVVQDGIHIAPKPIVVHVDSPGGNLDAAMRFLTAFHQSRTPICTLIEGHCASAATILSIAAPYRVITDLSLVLLHQYSGYDVEGTRVELVQWMQVAEGLFQNALNMYLSRTKYTKKELEALLRHDLWLNAETCLQKGLVDRVLNLQKGKALALKKYKALSPQYDLPSAILLQKTNINTMFFQCDTTVSRVDDLLRRSFVEPVKPIIFYPKGYVCESQIRYEGPALIARIQALQVPTYCVLDAWIDLETYLPMLFCTKRFMYDHAKLSLNLLRFKAWAVLLDDIVANTNTYLEKITSILKQKTKLPAKLINNINREMIVLDAKQCLKYKLCDEIIPVHARR